MSVVQRRRKSDLFDESFFGDFRSLTVRDEVTPRCVDQALASDVLRRRGFGDNG
jgi:hypothetical protein